MKEKLPQRQQGFTLIELSIVLVIIALVAAGVVVGKHLVKNAQLRAQGAEGDKFIRAINTFRLKYGCLPGDCPNATTFWGTDPNGCPNTPYNDVPKQETCNGNGDGKVGDFSSGTTVSTWRYEWHRFWQQLANAGLIEGTFTGAPGQIAMFQAMPEVNAPRTMIRDGSYRMYFIAYDWAQGNWLRVGALQNSVGHSGEPLLTPKELYAIDLKFDDGRPWFGKIISHTSTQCMTSNNSQARYQAHNPNRSDVILCDYFHAMD